MERSEASGGEEQVEVDLSLIEAALAMTVEERLRLNDRTIRSIAKLRAGFAKLRAEGVGDAPAGRDR